MKLKKIISGILAAALALGLAGCGNTKMDPPAQDATFTVGILQYDKHPSLDEISAAVQAQLAALEAEKQAQDPGFKMEVVLKNGQGDAATINDICTLFMADKVDLIVPIATPAATTVAAATMGSSIPLVFSAVTDPVLAQLVDSMEAPGGLITGTSDYIDTQAIFSLATTQNPQLKKMGVVYNLSEPNSVATVAKAKPHLEEMGIELVESTVAVEGEVQMAAHNLISEGVEAIFVPIDNTVANAMSVLADEACNAKIPVFTAADSLVKDGGFATSGVNYTKLGEETAKMVYDILVNGQNPAQMPVKVLEEQQITVNATTAKALGIDPAQVFAGMDFITVD